MLTLSGKNKFAWSDMGKIIILILIFEIMHLFSFQFCLAMPQQLFLVCIHTMCRLHCLPFLALECFEKA